MFFTMDRVRGRVGEHPSYARVAYSTRALPASGWVVWGSQAHTDSIKLKSRSILYLRLFNSIHLKIVFVLCFMTESDGVPALLAAWTPAQHKPRYKIFV